MTACVVTGGLSTVTAKVAVTLPPGGRVMFSASVGGAVPAKVAFEPVKAKVTLSNQTKSSAPIVEELRKRTPVLVAM